MDALATIRMKFIGTMVVWFGIIWFSWASKKILIQTSSCCKKSFGITCKQICINSLFIFDMWSADSLYECYSSLAHVGFNCTNSLVNADSFYMNFTNITFQKVPRFMYLKQIPSLTQYTYRKVASRSTSRLVTPHVTNWD